MNHDDKKTDVKVTTTEEVTPEDLTPDLLDVDNAPRGPTHWRVAQELSRMAMTNFLAKLSLIHQKLGEDLRVRSMFGELAKHAEALQHNSRWWDEAKEDWVNIEWELDIDHLRFALIEKYDLVFDKCSELEEVFQELENLHALLEKLAETSK
jgi:hypothetical protein